MKFSKFVLSSSLVSVLHVSAGDYVLDLPDDLRQAVIEQLKDPESARFRNIRPALGQERHDSFLNGNMQICGEVNAKNSYGGYVGYRGFHASKDPNEDWKVDLLPAYSDDVSVDFKYKIYKNVLCKE